MLSFLSHDSHAFRLHTQTWRFRSHTESCLQSKTL
nr:MAG TPA: hypothetical protein [Bacteriophage sp.]